MKKTVFAVSAALAFLFCACDRNSADCLDAIPGNSQAVLRINPAALQKSGVDLSSAIDELNAAWNDEYDADIPYKGIDLQSDIYAFLSTEGRSNHFVGVTFALSDPKAFASSCSSAGRVKHDGDVDYIVDFDDVTIAWSGKAGIMLAGLDDQGSGRMADLAVSLLSGGQVPGGQFVATPSYGSLKSVKGPVAGIIDYSLYMDILDDNDVDFDEIVGEIGEYDRKLSRALKAWDYSDLAVVFGVDFDGEVMGLDVKAVSPRGTNDALIAESLSMLPAIKSSSLAKLSSSSQAGLLLGFSGPAILDWLKKNTDSFSELSDEFDEALEEIGLDGSLSLAKLLGSIDGVAALGFDGVTGDEIPKVTLSLPAGNIYDDVVGLLQEAAGDELVRSGNGWSFEMDGADVSFQKDGGDIVLSTFSQGGSKGSLPPAVASACAGKAMAMFADVDGILSIVSELTYDDDDVRQARKFLRKYFKDTRYVVISVGR